MKRLKINYFLAFLMLFGQLQAQTSQPSQDVFPYKIDQRTLDNGLQIVTVPYNSPGLAAFYIVVRVGSREEVEPGKSGFAHFFEHMMFRGTEKYPKEKYADVLKGIGASANANTWWDRTLYHMTGNAQQLEKMFELEADRFQNLKYSEAHFKVEAGAVKGEYIKNFSNPSQQLAERTNKIAFDKHTYKHLTIGFWEDVVDMPNQYKYSLEFFDRFYRPEYSTIIVVGDVTPEQVNKLSKQYFGNWKRGSYKAEIPVEPEQKETRYAHLQDPNYPPYIGLNYKGPAFSVEKKDKAALDLFAAIAFSQKSEIYKKLVLQEQKVRNIGAYGFDVRDPGLFTIYASLLKQEDLQYVKDEMEKVIKQVQSSPLKNEDLNEAKSRMRYSFAMGLDNPSSIAEALSEITWLTGNPADINKLYNLYDSITPEDIVQAAKKYLLPERLTISTISSSAESPFKK